jgi:hypothetical protein
MLDLISESTIPIDHIIFLNSPDTHLQDTSKQLLRARTSKTKTIKKLQKCSYYKRWKYPPEAQQPKRSEMLQLLPVCPSPVTELQALPSVVSPPPPTPRSEAYECAQP